MDTVEDVFGDSGDEDVEDIADVPDLFGGNDANKSTNVADTAQDDGASSPDSVGASHRTSQSKKRKSESTRSRKRKGDGEGDGDNDNESKRRRTKKPKKEKNPNEERPEEDINDPRLRARRDLDAAFKAISRSRPKKEEQDNAKLEAFIVELTKEMNDAAMEDIRSFSVKKPALKKLALLPKVQSILIRKDIAEIALDADVLVSMRMWLEPYEDGTLPALNIRKTFLELLDRLPIDKDHLVSSGIGKVINFLTMNELETNANRKAARELVQKWAKPLLKQAERQFEEENPESEPSRDGQRTRSAPRFENVDLEIDKKKSEPANTFGTSQFHARIPQPVQMGFKVRPKDRISAAQGEKSSRKAASGNSLLDKLKRGSRRGR